MFKTLLTTFLIWLSLTTCYGQLNKIYIKENGKVTKDSAKAYGYILFKKIGVDQDSVYAAIEYDITQRPILKGHFLDKDFTIPHGKFDFYREAKSQTKVGEHASKVDTIRYVFQTGFFNNGKKDGVWMEYYPDGTPHFLRTFVNDKLNGQFQEYSFNGLLHSESNFVEGTREGETYIYRADGSVQQVIYFRNDVILDRKNYDENQRWVVAKPGFNFAYYLYKYLRKLDVPIVNGNVILSFIVTENGKLIKPSVDMGLNSSIDSGLVAAVNNSPLWVPASLNKKNVQQHIHLSFNYGDKSYDYLEGKK